MKAQNVISIGRSYQAGSVPMVPLAKLQRVMADKDMYQRLYVQNTAKMGELKALLHRANAHIAEQDAALAALREGQSAELLAEAMEFLGEMVMEHHALQRALGESIRLPAGAIEHTAKSISLIARAAVLQLPKVAA